MRNHVINIPGRQTITTVVTNKHDGARSENTYPGTSKGLFKELYNVSGTVGDGKAPNSQSYRIFQQQVCKGSQVTSLDLGQFIYSETITGDMDIMPSAGSLPDTSLASERAYGDMSDQIRGGLDLSVDLAQSGQTAAMLKKTLQLVRDIKKHPVETLRKNYAAYKRDIDRGASRMSKAGSQWLEFQYGWKPLASSIYDTASNLFGELTGGNSGVHIRARGVERNIRTVRNVVNGVVSTTHFFESARCEISLRLKVEDNVNQQLSHYTSLNPASIAWELTPYSFVVDWVYDVGGYIRNLESAMLHSQRFKSGYSTLTRRVDVMHQVVGNRPLGGSNNYISNYKGSAFQAEKVRSVLNSFPWPRPPVVKADLGSGQLLNAAALLSQFMGRR